jgi:hypothetical protein
MGSYDDDNIEFDFFDEPETVEASPRGRRMARAARSGGDGPRRPPMRAPTGLVPLARLVGLIAIAIVVVVAFVFWVGACQGKSKHDEYASYTGKVRTLAQSSTSLGQEFASKLISAGLKLSDLETSLSAYAQQEQQAYDAAQQIRPPGPLRALHQRMIDALELRAKGLAGLGDVLAQTSSKQNASTASKETDALTAQGQLLTASDVVWDQLYRLPAKLQLEAQGVKGVIVPESHFVSTPDLVSARSFGLLLQRLGAATASSGSSSSASGSTSGPHGDELVSVEATPPPTTLSTGTATPVKVSAGLSFVATVKDSGNFPEYNVPVTLTINTGGTPIVQTKKILVIQPAATTTVTFSNFQLPPAAFGSRNTSVKVEVAPVAQEINTSNNSATYTVFFTLG